MARQFYDYRVMKVDHDKQTLFGRRLKAARISLGIPQDKLGVLIGIDEGCSSARISRYESGIHAPPIAIAKNLADILGLPLAYFYCEDDWLADFLKLYANLDVSKQQGIQSLISDHLSGVTPIK